MRLSRALWPDDDTPTLYAWGGNGWVVELSGRAIDGRGRTKAAAIANLLRKLERLAEKREERLGAALVALYEAKKARET